MIDSYNPLNAPDPGEWLELPEEERAMIVTDYHLRHDDEEFEDGSLQIHSVIHVVVENQIALGDEYPVKQTAERLMEEGLDRHDAIHAIGSVLAKYLWEVGKGEASEDFSNDYFEELKTFTANDWLDEYS
ncbi:MAG: DUF1841 family protein [Balneolaceae bacterium]